jgi:AraC-like DNA-binding protein
MPAIRSDEKDFIKRITEIVEENISNDQFGVTGLANEVGMSRSNLLRKVKKLTNLSASQFIREVRLKQADKLLKDSSMTVSEIAYRVGFGSPSYFIKCYGDYFGHPPGDAVKNADTGIIQENISETEAENVAETYGKKEKSVDVKWSFILMVAVLLWFLFFATDFFKDVGHFFSLIKAEK